MNTSRAIQDQITDNHCYGCGADNEQGLQIKSFWRDDVTTECRFQPQAHQCAGPLKYLNGGVIATVIDCHAVCTALAKAYKDAERAIGDGEPIWFVTGKLDLSYLRPTVITEELLVTATIIEVKEKKIVLKCELFSQGEKCVVADVTAIRVPNDWA